MQQFYVSQNNPETSDNIWQTVESTKGFRIMQVEYKLTIRLNSQYQPCWKIRREIP